MKKIVTIVLCLAPLFGISQTVKPLDSLIHIPFGSNFQAVVESLRAIGGQWDTKNSNPNSLIFHRVKFDGNSLSIFRVKFSINIAYEIEYLARPNSGSILDYYDNLVKKLNNAYGEGKSTRMFKLPYKDGDGNELKAIAAGSTEIDTFWPVNGKTILLTINQNLVVSLKVQDDDLEKAAITIEKAGN